MIVCSSDLVGEHKGCNNFKTQSPSKPSETLEARHRSPFHFKQHQSALDRLLPAPEPSDQTVLFAFQASHSPLTAAPSQ